MPESSPVVNMPLVTVITITYNSAAFIRQAIDSILSQSYKQIELIVADDGSTDGTLELVSKYNDPRIRFVANEKNLGEYENRNYAVMLARGKYISFIDGDDVLLYRGIEDAVREMERFQDCGFAIVRPENPKYIGPIEIKKQDSLQLEFFGGGVLDSSLANNFYRTSFLQKHLFLEGYKNSDTYSRIVFAKYSNVLVLISPIAIWRQSAGQASKNIPELVRMREQLSFFRDHIFSDDQFPPDRVPGLKRIYYRTLVRYLVTTMSNGRLNWTEFRSFIIDPPLKVLGYLFEKPEREYWSEYNYNNLNITIGNG